MAAWLVDGVFNEIPEDTFVHSNLHFTMLPSGAVKYSRIRKA